MSRASTSAVRRTKAFLRPSGLHQTSISHHIPTIIGQNLSPNSRNPNAPDQSVDLDTVDIVELLDGILDLSLVRLDVDNEDQGVVLLNLLHGRLGVQRVHDDLELVQPRHMGNALAGVLGLARELEGVGPVESNRGADFLVDLGVHTLKGGLLRVGGLLGGRLGPYSQRKHHPSAICNP